MPIKFASIFSPIPSLFTHSYSIIILVFLKSNFYSIVAFKNHTYLPKLISK